MIQVRLSIAFLTLQLVTPGQFPLSGNNPIDLKYPFHPFGGMRYPELGPRKIKIIHISGQLQLIQRRGLHSRIKSAFVPDCPAFGKAIGTQSHILVSKQPLQSHHAVPVIETVNGFVQRGPTAIHTAECRLAGKRKPVTMPTIVQAGIQEILSIRIILPVKFRAF